MKLHGWFYTKPVFTALAGSGRIKKRATHFWNFLGGLLCTENLAFRLQQSAAIVQRLWELHNF